MMYNLAIGAFIIFGGFAFMAFLADYIIPALFENNGMEWDDYSE
jgi:O-antigen/teichoic acid export membrane protein